MFAVVRIAGNQYKIEEGDTLVTNHLTGLVKDQKFAIEDVLLLASDSHVAIGYPRVQKVHVEASVIDNFKGEKIHVAKYKSKVRYRRKMGFRPQQTSILIEKIVEGESQENKESVKARSKAKSK